MKINEIITEKEQLDEVLPLIPLAIAGGKAIAGHFGRHAIQHGAKKLATLGAKAIKKAPPTPGDGSELDKTAMVPGPQAYHKKAVAGAGVAPKNKFSKAIGPMSNLERKRLK